MEVMVKVRMGSLGNREINTKTNLTMRWSVDSDPHVVLHANPHVVLHANPHVVLHAKA